MADDKCDARVCIGRSVCEAAASTDTIWQFPCVWNETEQQLSQWIALDNLTELSQELGLYDW